MVIQCTINTVLLRLLRVLILVLLLPVVLDTAMISIAAAAEAAGHCDAQNCSEQEVQIPPSCFHCGLSTVPIRFYPIPVCPQLLLFRLTAASSARPPPLNSLPPPW